MQVEADRPPLLSIVIPTRNRSLYAISAIQSVLEIPDPRLELVVQDNSDSRELESYVDENIKDIRFRYRYTPPPLSYIDNFNAAVGLATGDYVCLIGDDDGVNPEIVEAASWAKSEGVDSLAVRTRLSYYWPGAGVPSTVFTKAPAGSISVFDFQGYIRGADTEAEMLKLLRNGGLVYSAFDLPKLYHGLVHTRCLKVVREKVGVYFGGLSPDVFASLTVACVADRSVVTDYPLIIPGACSQSSTVNEGSLRRFSKKVEDAPHLRDRGEYHWCELVPRVYTAQTIWADSGIAALRAMGRNDLVRQLNLPKLAVHCIVRNPGFAGPVLRDLVKATRIMGRDPFLAAVHFVWSFLMFQCVTFGRRVWLRFELIIGTKRVYRVDGLPNMVEASHALTRYLKDNGHSFGNGSRCKTDSIARSEATSTNTEGSAQNRI